MASSLRASVMYVASEYTIGIVALFFTASCLSSSSQLAVTDAIYGSADGRRFSSGPVSTSLGGAKLGYEARRIHSPLAGFVEAGYLRADTDWFTILSLGAGAKFAALTQGRLELGVSGSVEYQRARFDQYQNANHLVALGAGGYSELRITSTVAITLTLSAHAFADATSPTTCNDGSTSESTGQGTCSHHGGIAFYNDELGNGTGLDALLGMSVWFGGNR